MDKRVLLDVIRDLERQRAGLDRMITRLRALAETVSDRPTNGRWSADDDALLGLLVIGEGRPHAEAAKLLGRTTLAVSQRLHRLGLTSR